MTKALLAVFALLALIAYGIWFEFFHPLSYSNYRAWVADCPSRSEADKRKAAVPLPDCSVPYGAWQAWVEKSAAAPQR